MKTCLFCQLITRRAFALSTQDFQRCVPRIYNFLMVFVILEHTVCFHCYVAAKTIAFPIEWCTFTIEWCTFPIEWCTFTTQKWQEKLPRT